MEPMIERGAGLDILQATIVATVRVPGEAGGRQIVTQQPQRAQRQFSVLCASGDPLLYRAT